MSSTETKVQPSSMSVAASTRLWPALTAAFLGLVILYGVGIARRDLIHNGAHDTRHAVAFPCH